MFFDSRCSIAYSQNSQNVISLKLFPFWRLCFLFVEKNVHVACEDGDAGDAAVEKEKGGSDSRCSLLKCIPYISVLYSDIGELRHTIIFTRILWMTHDEITV